jgi:hypothetical protein
MRKHLGLSIAGLLIAASISSAAFAAIVTTDGGATISVTNKSNTAASTTSSTSLTNLLVGTSVTVPDGTRLITARFTGESSCTAEDASIGYCRISIVARKVGTAEETELSPAAGTNFAFDTVVLTQPNDDRYESHSMERSRRLATGDYVIKVYWSVTGEEVTFRLDDWHFRVETAE